MYGTPLGQMQDHPVVRSVQDVMAGRVHPYDAAMRYQGRDGTALLAALIVGGAPAQAIRTVLEVVWVRNHFDLTSVMRRDEVIQLFRRAAFPRPSNMPDTFTVWRGTCGEPLYQVQAGLSWTTAPDIACAFAFRDVGHHRRNDAPMVIKRSVRKSDVVFCTNIDRHSEVVLGAPPAGEIDGDWAMWKEGARRAVVGGFVRAHRIHLNRPHPHGSSPRI